MHFILHIITWIVRYLNKENAGYGSRAQSVARMYEIKIRDVGDMSRMTKDKIIMMLGQPNKIKNIEQGMQCMIWKGDKYKIEIYLDALDRFDHKSESYT